MADFSAASDINRLPQQRPHISLDRLHERLLRDRPDVCTHPSVSTGCTTQQRLHVFLDRGLKRLLCDRPEHVGDLPCREFALGGLGLPKQPAELTERQLRKRGRYGAAALLADQEALNEKEVVRALKARQASSILKELACKPVKIEFDFFRGNWSMADEYHDTIRERIVVRSTSTPLPLTSTERR